MLDELRELARRKVIILVATRHYALHLLDAWALDGAWHSSMGRFIGEGATIIHVGPDQASRVRGLNADMVIIEIGSDLSDEMMRNLHTACRLSPSRSIHYV